MNNRFRRVIAALLVPLVVVWSVIVPRQVFAFAPPVIPLALLPISSGTAVAGAVVAGVEGLITLVGGAIAAIGLKHLADDVGIDGGTLRVPTTSNPALAPAAPSAPATESPTTETRYAWSNSGWQSSASAACSAGVAAMNATAPSYKHYFGCGSTGGSCCVYWTDDNFPGWQSGNSSSPISSETTSSCRSGFTLSGGTCQLSDARAATADGNKDYGRGTSGYTAPSSTDADAAKTIKGVVNADGSMQIAGKNSRGNPVAINVKPMPDGGSEITVLEEKTDPVTKGKTVEQAKLPISAEGIGQPVTVVTAPGSLNVNSGSQTATVVAAPTALTNADGSASAVPASTPQTMQISFPSDYARVGEAASAATAINTALGPKLDAITATDVDPADPSQPAESEFNQAFFQGTFTSLLGWQLPAHSSQCPTSSFSFNSNSYSVDAHCQLVASHFSVLAAAMAVVWTIVALFILLGA